MILTLILILVTIMIDDILVDIISKQKHDVYEAYLLDYQYKLHLEKIEKDKIEFEKENTKELKPKLVQLEFFFEN